MSQVSMDDNTDEVGAWLDEHVSSYDFTVPGADQSLGRDMAGKVAEGIAERSVEKGLSSEGSPFKELTDRYKRRKKAKYSVENPGIRTGQMLSVESLLGGVTITADEVEIRYGTGDPPASSGTGFISDADKEVTDQQKAEWFTAGGRPFFALDAEINEACAILAAEALGEHLKRNL